MRKNFKSCNSSALKRKTSQIITGKCANKLIVEGKCIETSAEFFAAGFFLKFFRLMTTTACLLMQRSIHIFWLICNARRETLQLTENVFEYSTSTFSSLQVSWIRKRDLHILTTGASSYTSDQRFQVTRITNK
jgi:hypothetical protein